MLASVTLVLLLTACASIPLATALKLRNFDAEAFANLDPDVVRFKLSMPKGFALDVSSARLAAELETASGTLVNSFALDLPREVEETVETGWFSEPMQINSYWMALTDKSKIAMKEVQAALATRAEMKREVSATWRFSESPDKFDNVQVWVALKLFADEDYILLIDGGEIEFSMKDS